MRHTLKWLAVAVVAVSVSGCIGGSGYRPQKPAKVEPVAVPQDNLESLFPLKQGQKWVYAVTRDGQGGSQNEGDWTFEVTRVKRSGSTTTAVMEVSRPGASGKDSTGWMVNSKGLYQTYYASASEGSTLDFEPAQLVLPCPWKEGQTFDYKGVGPFPTGGVGVMSVKSKVLGVQQVDTDVKPMSAVAVESVTTYTAKNRSGQPLMVGGKPAHVRAVSTTWFAPNVGIVRLRQEVGGSANDATITLRLKSLP